MTNPYAPGPLVPELPVFTPKEEEHLQQSVLIPRACEHSRPALEKEHRLCVNDLAYWSQRSAEAQHALRLAEIKFNAEEARTYLRYKENDPSGKTAEGVRISELYLRQRVCVAPAVALAEMELARWQYTAERLKKVVACIVKKHEALVCMGAGLRKEWRPGLYNGGSQPESHDEEVSDG